MSYDDGRVACTDDALTGMSGRYRLWGSGDFVHWANWDPDRPKKSVALIISIPGRNMRPAITPDDPDAVATELAGHGVSVS